MVAAAERSSLRIRKSDDSVRRTGKGKEKSVLGGWLMSNPVWVRERERERGRVFSCANVNHIVDEVSMKRVVYVN